MPVRCCPVLRHLLARHLLILGAAIGCWLVLAAAMPAYAQLPRTILGTGASKPETAAADPARPSVEEVDRLARTLEDPDQRADLIRKLRLLAQAGAPPTAPADQPTGEGLLDGVARVADTVVKAIIEAGALVTNVPALYDWLVDQLDDAESRARWFGILRALAIVFGSAALVEVIAWWALRRPRQALARRHGPNRWRRLPYAVARGLLELIPVAGFAGIAYGALALLPPEFAARYVSLTIIEAVVMAGVAVAVARAVLMPDAPGLRMLPLGDESANYVMIWVHRFIAIGVYGLAVLDIVFLLGLPVSLYGLLRSVVGLVLAGLAVVFVLQNAAAVSEWLRSPPDGGGSADSPAEPRAASPFRAWLAEAWHLLAIAYIALLATIWLFQVPSGLAFVLRASALSVLVIILAAVAQAAARRLIRRVFSVNPDLAREFPNIEGRANRYMVIVGIVASATIATVALILVLEAWGLRSLDWLSSPLGQRLTGGAISILVVGLLALFVWDMVDRLIDRTLQRLSRQTTVAGSTVRLRTFLPLLRNVALVVLATVFMLVALSEIGVNIAPLLAGASIIGIAVAFGANALVKDVITGLFILIEGTINIGDVVEVDGRSGVVEGLSIRTMRLRDLTGAVHTVPFSNVTSVKNMTRDFSFAVIDASVAYHTNLNQAMQVLAGVEEEMRADPAFTGMIAAPLEMLGVDRFADSAIVIRARIRTPPGKQWTISREFNRRMKQAFDQAGIEIPFPHQVVVGEGGGRANDPRLQIAGGAPKGGQP